jgi:AcrR family transcriptional regulator
VLDRKALLQGAALHFQQHATLNMDLLARELSISRATLYRAVGSRDKLLGDVFGAITRWLFDEAHTRVGVISGPEDVLAVTRTYVRMLQSAEPLRTFIAEDPQMASRILFTTAGDVQRRSVEEQARVLREAGVGGDDPGGRAFLYVRIVESVLFAELLGHGRRELAVAEPALRALLS